MRERFHTLLLSIVTRAHQNPSQAPQERAAEILQGYLCGPTKTYYDGIYLYSSVNYFASTFCL